MKFIIYILVATIILASIIGYYYFWKKSGENIQLQTPTTKTLNMRITSPAFENNQPIPRKYTCDGENINPPLIFADLPEEAKSLVLIVDDPDAPMGTFTHWTVWNIDPGVSFIPENSVPEGAIEGMTDFGKPGYGGPCPPSGTHRYFFKLYALNTVLILEPKAKVNDLMQAIKDYIIAQAELIGTYSR